MVLEFNKIPNLPKILPYVARDLVIELRKYVFEIYQETVLEKLSFFIIQDIMILFQIRSAVTHSFTQFYSIVR